MYPIRELYDAAGVVCLSGMLYGLVVRFDLGRVGIAYGDDDRFLRDVTCVFCEYDVISGLCVERLVVEFGACLVVL